MFLVNTGRRGRIYSVSLPPLRGTFPVGSVAVASAHDAWRWVLRVVVGEDGLPCLDDWFGAIGYMNTLRG